MRPCGLCGCTDRQGAYVVAIASTVVYCIHLISVSLVISNEIPTNMDHVQLLALLISAVILIVLSLLLFFGIYYNSKCLILPWLILVILANIGYCSTMIGYFVVIITGPHNDNNLIAFFAAMLNVLVVTYLLWVILLFFIDLFSFSSNNSSDRRSGSYERVKN